jgi:hypothetical protein
MDTAFRSLKCGRDLRKLFSVRMRFEAKRCFSLFSSTKAHGIEKRPS